ncbi:dicarboxylate/amino acid:cation symporter [Acinetobacter sp. ANC 4558]|uniref:dicarboxylate/amino acid:cation symporter n=1 Tax=Acinetobacter sp. ANC 4558 TaxID=1977876 RepID=UPI000A32BF9B|nr:dicarboxylate/amino acid:cation symporter [Acinetobacter sp. ANC 4558]OTG79236.1 dicarboxylate/amino acid:cation symporter [Acinetobacter sp. ANC 4558]
MNQKILLKYILIAIISGILVGWVCHSTLNIMQATDIASYFKIVTDVFLRLIKMIIAPLVFATIVSGLISMGKSSSLGSITFKAMGWFICASLISLMLGMGLANIFQPGAGMNLSIPKEVVDIGVSTSSLSLQTFITHIFPRSFAEAMANNEILQILVFSIFFGSALAYVQHQSGNTIIGRIINELCKVMFRITDYVMAFAPIAVFAAIVSAIAIQGPKLIIDYGIFIAEFYIGLLILWSILIFFGYIFLKKDIFRLLKVVREPTILAFATASSESAYPKTMEALNKFGVPKRITSFVLPLGYSFNLDGSMMYVAFAVLFIAQAYNIDLSFTQQLLILFTLMITSKGIAGVSRASIVVIASTLAMFKLPEAGILLILAIDQFLDMGRTATNVIGNSIATAVVARSEGNKYEDIIEQKEIIHLADPILPASQGIDKSL